MPRKSDTPARPAHIQKAKVAIRSLLYAQMSSRQSGADTHRSGKATDGLHRKRDEGHLRSTRAQHGGAMKMARGSRDSKSEGGAAWH